MATADLTAPMFNDEDAAWAHFEATVWPDGPVCPHCGSVNNATRLKGKSTRRGVHKCKDCLDPFTATVGTVYERSHIPMHKWLLATHLMCASKKGVSAAQLHRMLGFGSYRTAWFMAHRIREAMRPNGALPPLGGEGKVVEADETYYGNVEHPREHRADGRPYNRGFMGKRKVRGGANKRAVVALVERGGEARTFHVAVADRETVEKIIRENAHPASRLHTDESKLYPTIGKEFTAHETVKHTAGEYVRGDVHNNSCEGYFGVFKKGMTGVYQHCAEKHLSRYLDEFSFRHNTRAKLGVSDKERAALAVKGTVGKRLTYRQPDHT
jgi:transposase-like protein